LSEFGHTIIQNFYDLTNRHIDVSSKDITFEKNDQKYDVIANIENENDDDKSQFCVVSRKVPITLDPENIFDGLFAKEKHCFWLDSQNAGENEANYSFMGTVKSEDVYSYDLNQDNEDFLIGENFLSHLNTLLVEVSVEDDHALPFDFRGGMVGFFSYEMRVLFAQDEFCQGTFPDALWMKVEHFIAFDHVQGCAWVVSVGPIQNRKNMNEKIEQTYTRMLSCSQKSTPRKSTNIDCVEIHMALDANQYKSGIEKCRDSIVKGESYELCLTNKFIIEAKVDAFELYKHMRSDNAAPFGAYIKSDENYILSTSPERFLKVNKDSVVETKPIKGTITRSSNKVQDALNAQELKQSEKDRAENLMIVDLMRNDLSRVSIAGSVEVPKLMDIESYKTVHHLVSTVQSILKPDCTLIDLLRATFPGGSISGAPKIRSMKILQQLEGFSRGVYCGAIGYLGYNRITDLNIGIRTLSYDGDKIEFGAGGAITYLSDTDKEYDEILLKAEALLTPIIKALQGQHSEFNEKVLKNVISFEVKNSSSKKAVKELSF
jgi:para-aminobenzoate synthetase